MMSNTHLTREFHTFEVNDTRFEVLRRYVKLKPIGSGSQGVVSAAEDQLDKLNIKKVAIKKISKPFQNITHAKRTFRELKILRQTNHVNIIKLLDVFTPQKSLDEFYDLYLVTELMDADLSRVIPMDVDHTRISFLTYQMLCGLKHLHSAGIIHRDLKPSNIVVDGRCNLKILDFGLARSTDEKKSMTQYVVTRYYRSPEIIFGMPYGPKVDIWSVGCIIGELIWGQILFRGDDHFNQWSKIVEILGTPSKEFTDCLRETVRNFVDSLPHRNGVPFDRLFPDEKLPEDSKDYEQLNLTNALDLLSKMLVIDPRHRLTVDEALQHPYVNLWFKDDDVNGPPPAVYDQSTEAEDFTVDQWRKLIYDQVKDYEASKATS